jgi:hypothetical protein
MNAPEYIWITRWESFQHYKPERDRAPAWVKLYTKQLSDDTYLNLTAVQRALLHDLRMEFARAHHKLTTDTRRLSHRIGYRVTRASLDALNHAGFMEYCSRATLDRRLDEFYSNSSPHARPRARKEGEGEEEVEKELTLAVDATRNGATPNEQHNEYGGEPEPREDPPADLHEIFLRETTQ